MRVKDASFMLNEYQNHVRLLDFECHARKLEIMKIESWQKLGGISLVLQFASRWHRFSYEIKAPSAGRMFQIIN